MAIKVGGTTVIDNSRNLSNIASVDSTTASAISGEISINNDNWSGTDLSVANGGTGASSFTANSVLLGNGTSAFQEVAPGTSGNVLTSNGTTWASTAPAAGGVSGINYQVFTSSGTYTPTSGYTYAVAYVTGGGGGGGTTNSTGYNGGGGGGGATAIQVLDLSGISTLSVTIGSGGAGKGAGSSGAGTAGGSSSLSGTGMSTMTANGGGAGPGGASGSLSRATATGGDLNIEGGYSTSGGYISASATQTPPSGGASFWADGGAGAASAFGYPSWDGVKGSGGGGGVRNSSGGNGGNGIVVIVEYK